MEGKAPAWWAVGPQETLPLCCIAGLLMAALGAGCETGARAWGVGSCFFVSGGGEVVCT